MSDHLTNAFGDIVKMPGEQGIEWLAEREGEIIARGEDLSAFAIAAFEGDIVRAYDILDVLYRQGKIDRAPENQLTEPYRRGRRRPAGVPLDVPTTMVDYVEPLTDDDRSRTERYFNAIDSITASWQHLTDALNAELARAWSSYKIPGPKPEASMWQTGGMCMLIGWTFNIDGRTYEVMIGEADGPLSHDRAEAAKHGGYSLSVGSEDDQMTGEAQLVNIPGFSARMPEHDERAAKFMVAMVAAMLPFAVEQAESVIA